MVKVLKQKWESFLGDDVLRKVATDDLQVIIAAMVGIAAFLTFLSVGCSGMKTTPLPVPNPVSDSWARAASTQDVGPLSSPNLHHDFESHGRYGR